MLLETTDTVETSSDTATVKSTTKNPGPNLKKTARWFDELSALAKSKVKFIATDDLTIHPACDFVPFYQPTQDSVEQSVKENGILLPLALAKDGRVIDGRYRLGAAKRLGLKKLPTLTIGIDGDDLVHWIFHVKYDREHLSLEERLLLAHQYQKRLSGEYIKIRAKKMTAAKLAPKKAKATKKRHSTLPRQDSRKEAAQKFGVPCRKLNALSQLSKDRPDLYEKLAAGELKVDAALKQRGKNVEMTRVTEATKLFVRPEDVVDGQMENRIHQGEAQDVLKKVADNTASLVLFSPPYFGANVAYEPRLLEMTYQQYLAQLLAVIAESLRISRSGGRLMMVVDTTHNPVPGGDEMLPIFADLTVIAREAGWKFWMDFAWLKPEICGSKTTFGSLGRCSAPGWGRDHEWILLFFKDVKKLEGDVALSDLSRDDHQEWWDSTWEIRAETRREMLAAHPAPCPEELVERAIKLLTYRRDLVVDPFNGSGTTMVVAKRLERRFVGIDRSPGYCAIARQRLAETQNDPARDVAIPRQSMSIDEERGGSINRSAAKEINRASVDASGVVVINSQLT